MKKTIISKTDQSKNRVRGQLRCNGKIVHVVNGPNGFKVCEDFAKTLNERGMPEPPQTPRLRADGWRDEGERKAVKLP